jgi:putative OPT family oligopeptide transporter
MRAVTEAIFEGKIPYILVGIGAGLAAVIMLVDFVAAKTKTGIRVPVLCVALGLYLPLELTVPIFLGGLTAYCASKTLKSERLQCTDRVRHMNENNGLLYAAGLITGEALLGIILGT